MKLSKIAVFGVVAAMSFGAFADAADTLVYFSSTGDTYADGTGVVDGEWYALVWENDGCFEGIAPDCTPADPDDKVLRVANPRVDEDGCREMFLKVKSSDAPTGGRYYVYVLDTREDGVPAKKGDNGKPTCVYGAKEASVYAVAGSMGGSPKGEPISGEWVASFIDTSAEGFQTAKVTKLNITSDGAEITVEGLMSGVRYALLTGTEVGKLDKSTKVQVKGEGDVIIFKVNDGSKFFKLIRATK